MSFLFDTITDVSGLVPSVCYIQPRGVEEQRAEGYIYYLLAEVMKEMSQSVMSDSMVETLTGIQQMPTQVKSVANDCAAYMSGMEVSLPESFYEFAKCSVINVGRTVTIHPLNSSSCYLEFDFNEKSMQIHMGGDIFSIAFMKEY